MRVTDGDSPGDLGSNCSASICGTAVENNVSAASACAGLGNLIVHATYECASNNEMKRSIWLQILQKSESAVKRS